MLERISELPGTVFDLPGYLDDFWPRRYAMDGVLWKLERIQTFREPDDPSWIAMTEGDWERSLRLIQDMRDEIDEEFAETRDIEMRRIRVVEFPVSAYLQWESHVFELRVKAGERIRVVHPDTVAEFEREAPLPELVVLGSSAMYQVLYDERDTPCGSRRINDPNAVEACQRELSEIYRRGEDFSRFFEREIVPLPVPKPSY